MATVIIETDRPIEDMTKSLARLSTRDLNALLDGITAIRSQRLEPELTPTETALLERIDQAISRQEMDEYEQLRKKLETRTLSAAEHTRLIALSDRIEMLQADRIEAVAEMARSRDAAFRDLWLQMGLGQQPNA